MIFTDRGRFQIEFPNGCKVSVFIGYGSYSSNKFNLNLIDPIDIVSCQNCEVAVIKDGKFVTDKFIDCENDVCGFVEPKKLAEIIYNVSKYIA